MTEKLKPAIIVEATKLGPDGRIVIPARLRKALGLKPGDELLIRLEDGELVVYTRAQAILRAQERVRQYVPEAVRLVNELLAERRREVEEEEREAAEWLARRPKVTE